MIIFYTCRVILGLSSITKGQNENVVLLEHYRGQIRKEHSIAVDVNTFAQAASNDGNITRSTISLEAEARHD